MVEKHKSKDTKKLAIEYYKNNNVSYEKVASIFQIGEKTLRRWIKQNHQEEEKSRIIRYKLYNHCVRFC
tara:strand:- start:890 stop:1096 length:207 start_codon:yes stop_codon:yes gene_type:complete